MVKHKLVDFTIETKLYKVDKRLAHDTGILHGMGFVVRLSYWEGY